MRILRFQKALGLPLAEFPELERYGGSGWIDNELSIHQGEQDEWLVDEELSIEERQLNQQLRREEQDDDTW